MFSILLGHLQLTNRDNKPSAFPFLKKKRQYIDILQIKLKNERNFSKKMLHLTCNIIFVSPSDDPGAVYPCSTAQPPPPERGFSLWCAGLSSSGNLWLEKEMLVLFHPPPPRHHDCQPGTDYLDSQSHELHSGKKRVCVFISLKCQNVIWACVYVGVYVKNLRECI